MRMLLVFFLLLLNTAACGEDGPGPEPDAMEDVTDAAPDDMIEADEIDTATDEQEDMDWTDHAMDDGIDGEEGLDAPDIGDPIEDEIEEEDPGPTVDPGWRVRTIVDTTLYHLESVCLEAVGILPAGTELDAWGMNEYWVRTTWTGQHIARSDIEIILEPPSIDDVPASWEGSVGLEETGIYQLDSIGCAFETGRVFEGDVYPAYGLSHDFNYQGFWQVSPTLDMIHIRTFNVPEWIFPWHRTVLVIKEIPEVGFLIGGGVLIAPNAILTAAHMAVDEEFCYVLAHNAADAWYAGEGVCGVLSEFVTHPDVDLGIMILTTPETRVPPAGILGRYAEVDDIFYTVNMSTMHHNAMTDGLIDEVDGRHNECSPMWPDGSSFTTQASIVGGGDSGGPAFIGNSLAGIIHGEACRWPWEPYRQVFVHVPFAASWIETVLGD